MKDKKQSLEETLKNINKKYGNKTALTVDKKENIKVEAFSTNCYSLDKVFGVGGLPKGRIIDIYGEFSAGKSTVALYIIAQVQKQGGTAVFIDAEYAFTSDYAKKIGVDTDKLILVQPSHGEQALNILEDFVNSENVDVIVFDSTGALVSIHELEGEMEDHKIALQARLMSKMLRMITAPAAKNKVAVIFISQLRQKIGLFTGPTMDTTGGKALKFYSSVRLSVKKIKTLKNKAGEVVGNRLKIEGTKSKISKPFVVAEVDLYFERGLDTIADVLDVSTQKGIVKKSGNTYSYAGKKLGVGRDEAVKYLRKDIDTFKKIKEQLLALDV